MFFAADNYHAARIGNRGADGARNVNEHQENLTALRERHGARPIPPYAVSVYHSTRLSL